MSDPNIEDMRDAVKVLRLVELLLHAHDNPDTDSIKVGITMARRYLAMMEEGPMGCVGKDGVIWEGNTKPDDPYDLDMMYPYDAPHKFVYAHPRED